MKKRLPRNSNPLPATSNQNTYAYVSPGTPPSGSYASPQVGVSGSQPVIPPKKSKPLLLYRIISGVALLFLVATLIVGGILIRSLNAQEQTMPTKTQNVVAAVSTQGLIENNSDPVLVTNTNALVVVQTTSTLQPSATSQPSVTPEPTDIPPSPTATYPDYYVRINDITLNSSNQYVVAYETFGYTEVLPGMHIHFFFDTVEPEKAGVPNSGPWILYGGPRPFTGYSTYQKPGDANQMCALVANADHTIILESGNCLGLPMN